MLMWRRKHHAACIIGAQMLIHGGIDTTGTILDEFVACDMVSDHYRKVEIDQKGLG